MSGAAKILTALLFALPLTILLSCADGSLPPSAPPGPYSFQSVVWNRWERSYFRPGRLAGCGKTRPEALLQGNFAVAACRDSKATSSFFTCWKPELCSAQGTSTSGVIPFTSFDPSARKRTQSGILRRAPEFLSLVGMPPSV